MFQPEQQRALGRSGYMQDRRPSSSRLSLAGALVPRVVSSDTLAPLPCMTLLSLVSCSKLCGDLVYVILFPQLLMVVHFRDRVNTYGSFVAFFLGLIVRLLGGEPYIGVPATIHYPFYDEELGQQNFPFRTIAMLVSLFSLIVTSAIAKAIFTHKLLPARYDVCRCFHRTEKDELGTANLNKTLPLQVSNTKEDVSPLKAAESNLYMPVSGEMNGV
ncbi:High-affinity choline transporter 1 [Portunus trituberculatus]|uniref:High-affinity choline transporter 1 n=1 Tax=Portunus trituberculatus TaxID=210409 RepID=A0A5B7EBA3_PORTR|nr:High-affinity choline transporter 1 [Portunus trituberculatus]